MRRWYFVGCDDGMPRSSEKLAVSPVFVSQLSRQLGNEVGSRASQSIEAGTCTLYSFLSSIGHSIFCYKCLLGNCICVDNFGVVVGFIKLSEKVENQLLSKKRVRKYSSRYALRREMLTLNPVFPDFASGSSTGAATHFYCKVCHRNLKMVARGPGEFVRHFSSDGHWFKDVTYRVHMGLQVYNRMLEPVTLTEAQRAEYETRPFTELSEGYPRVSYLFRHSCVMCW